MLGSQARSGSLELHQGGKGTGMGRAAKDRRLHRAAGAWLGMEMIKEYEIRPSLGQAFPVPVPAPPCCDGKDGG